jgi:hypothetical protein
MRNRLMPIGGLATLEKEGFSPRVSAALAPEWASLPTETGRSYYGQPVKKLSELQKVYGQNVQPTASALTPSPETAKAVEKGNSLADALLGYVLKNSLSTGVTNATMSPEDLLKASNPYNLTPLDAMRMFE